MTILPRPNVIGGLIKIGTEGGGGIEASTREGNPRRRNNQCKRLGESCRTFRANTRPQLPCASRNFPSCPEPVDATSADVFSLLSAFSSNPRASIVRLLSQRNFLLFRRVFHCGSNLQFFSLLPLFLSSPSFPPEKETHGGGICNFISESGRRFQKFFVSKCMYDVCIVYNAINPSLIKWRN